MSDYVVDETEVTEIDADIQRFERMPISEVNKELKKYGIDAARTIEDVKKLLKQHPRPAAKRRR
jgi:hypothetical protein